MIFVTVGHELGFDRLIEAVDKYAENHPDLEIFAQIGEKTVGSYVPEYLEYSEFLTPSEFNGYFRKSAFVVAHAGMGSIITALMEGKPIAIMPRRGHLMETRNDHQVATAVKFDARPGIFVAKDEKEIPSVLNEVGAWVSRNIEAESASPFADDSLIAAIRDFIHDKEG